MIMSANHSEANARELHPLEGQCYPPTMRRILSFAAAIQPGRCSHYITIFCLPLYFAFLGSSDWFPLGWGITTASLGTSAVCHLQNEKPFGQHKLSSSQVTNLIWLKHCFATTFCSVRAVVNKRHKIRIYCNI